MRVRLRLIAVSSLVVAAASCAAEPEIRSVLFVDGMTSDIASQPVDLELSARELGCATVPIFSVGCITLTVDEVVSARELIITGQYGRERIRPWLEIGTVARLAERSASEGEIIETLQRELVGRRLLEPASSLAPPVTADGLRIVGIFTTDLKPLDSVVSSMLYRWPREQSSEATSFGDVDLAVVPRDDASLAERVRLAVAEAERWSNFRAAPGLVVEWGDAGDMGDAVASVLDEHATNTCLAAADGLEQFTARDHLWGVSLPGGRILIQEDRDWHELDLRWVLLHELMHQHQFSLCASGMELGNVPKNFWQAHATSLAIEILQRQGLSEAELAFVRERDTLNGATRGFDEFRAQRGLSPDECLRAIASDPELASRLRIDVEGPTQWELLTELPAPAVPNDGLVFECTQSAGVAVVTIINESDSPFSGSSDGWWYSTSAGAEARQRPGADAPFALSLPPRGRVALRTHGIAPDADSASCFTVFRRTPAPVFGR